MQLVVLVRRFFNSAAQLVGRREGRPKGLSIDPQKAWQIAPPERLDGLAAALQVLITPNGAIALENTAFDKRAAEVLKPFSVTPMVRIEPGTIYPQSKWLHIRATEQALLRLQELAVSLPGPQVCNHFYAYENGQLILEWPDAFQDPLFIAGHVPEHQVLEFCKRLQTRVLKKRLGPPDRITPQS